MAIEVRRGFRRILLAVDDSPHSAAAATSVAVVAASTGAEVLVLHIWDVEAAMHLGESREAADSLVAEVADRLAAQGITTRERVRVSPRGEAAEEIEAMVSDYQPDLLALGSHGRTNLAALALGSVSHRVLEHVHCPVLVGRYHPAGSAAEMTRILLALAGSESDAAAIELAGDIALSLNASVVVLHVLRSFMDMTGSAYLQPSVVTNEVLLPAVRFLNERGLEAEMMVIPGSAPSTIVQTAQANNVGLIVLGPGRRSSNLAGILDGDTTNDVVHLSDRPILIAAPKPRRSAVRANHPDTARKIGDGWGAGLEGKY